AAASLVVCLADPSFGVHQHVNAGDWKGLWYEKNQMGSLMTQGVLAATVAATLSARRRRLWIATAALCAFMVVMSRSATDLFMLAAVLLGLAVLHAARRGPVFAVIGAWICVTLAGLLASAAALWPDHFYRAIGKDPTLTGRTDIWVIVGHWIAKAPWLGYGYGGFWSRTSPPAQYIRDELGWLVPNAHTGWLDRLLQLGIVGAIVAAAVFVLAAAAALFRGSRLKDGYWSVMFLITFAFATVSESVILQENNLAWVLCAAAVARLLGPAPAAPARPQLRLVA
ncbi:MAG: O-antigen ligase family protein, partial [Caulobacteraceae bacterium]